MAGKESRATRTLVPQRRCSSANEQQADRLAETTARLLVIGEAQHEILETRGQSTPDPTASPRELEAADVTDGE